MSQVADILDLAMQAKQQNIDAVLATVVRTEGSAYRHAGAMMFICTDGRSVGMISGGCLEPHIIKRAFWLTRNGANVQVYQTGDDITYSDDSSIAHADIDANEESLTIVNDDLEEDDLLDSEMDGELNFGLGCNGRVHVLFERLPSAVPLLDLIRQVRSTQRPSTIATLVKSDNPSSRNAQLQIGMRIDIEAYRDSGQLNIIDDKQNFSDGIEAITSNTLTNAAKELSAHSFDKRNAEYVIVQGDLDKQLTNSSQQNTDQNPVQTEWLIQQIRPQTRLLICGAGNDVMPLVTMAKLQDWHVTVIDSRSQYATRVRFPQADMVMCLPLEDSKNLIDLSADAAVALMSHSLTQDRARLAVLLAHPNSRYLGQLGPRYRTERLIKEISATMTNTVLLEEGIAKLHYPIGYKLGGDGPEALALSIMAQISAVIQGQIQQLNGLDSKASLPVAVRKVSMQLEQSPTEFTYINDCIKGYAHD